MKPTIRDIDLRGRRVLLRTDYNVETTGPFVLDDLRIRVSVSTIRALRDEGARIIVCSHRGRPHGRPVEDLSLAPVATHLADLLGMPVHTTRHVVGPEAEAEAARVQRGELLMLENLRFHPGEETNDDAFARGLAGMADVFVQDGFGALHREHASVVGVPRHVPSVIGLAVERELLRLEEVIERAEHPFVLILGGAKVTEKLDLLEHLLPRVDVVCVGGAAANAVLAAQGKSIGMTALPDGDEAIEAGRRFLLDLEKRPEIRLVLPTDVVATYGNREAESARVLSTEEIPPGYHIMDIGRESRQAIIEAVQGARTVVWNGPLGVFEHPPFDEATTAVAEAVASIRGHSVAAGGETVAAVRWAEVDEDFWHLSVGGGATLRFLSGRPLAGLEAIPDAVRIPGG